jgi:DNA polymerase III epsilon subunit-like protein
MDGWEPIGKPFRILLNHDVPIEPMAEAVHGYSREYLRKHGADPRMAHGNFHEYCGTLPIVTYNLSYDWDRVLFPEYGRLNVPQTGVKGFCALTLSRRAITETKNLKLPTLKEHFKLSSNPSHRGLNDVESLVRLFATVLRPRLEPAGISGFDELASFSRTTPVVSCLERLQSAIGQREVWYVLTDEDQKAGPFSLKRIKELADGNDCYVRRDEMPNWELASRLPEFSDSFLKPKKKSKTDEDIPKRSPRSSSGSREAVAEIKSYLNQLIGICKGILADGVISEEELMMLYGWIESCPYTHIYPMSVIADTLEKVCEDGKVTTAEQAELARVMNEAIEANE